MKIILFASLCFAAIVGAVVTPVLLPYTGLAAPFFAQTTGDPVPLPVEALVTLGGMIAGGVWIVASTRSALEKSQSELATSVDSRIDDIHARIAALDKQLALLEQKSNNDDASMGRQQLDLSQQVIIIKGRLVTTEMRCYDLSRWAETQGYRERGYSTGGEQ